MVLTPQLQKPQVVDPDHVPETMCDGRFFIHAHGQLATLTFTVSRPIATNLADGRIINEDVVRARITMPFGNFIALRELLNTSIKEGSGQIPAGTASSDTKH